MNGIHKLSSVCLAILSSIILVGCTLTMDEWVETEETKGYDDVETVENDFYKFSYQYKENTRSLTTDIQKYIAQVEADSIIWFTDNIPQGWLPQVGGGVVANCCQNFPMGLLAKVETIDHLSGMYRVQTTSAKIEELYDEFDLDLNTDIYTAPVEDVEEESGEEGSEAKAAGSPMQERIEYAATRSGEGCQVVIRDWTMFHDMERGTRSKPSTRADDIWDQNVNETDEKTSDILIVDASSIIRPILKSLTNGHVNSADLKVISTTKTKMHKIVQLSSKREYTETTTHNGFKIDFKVGHDLKGTKAKDIKEETKILKEVLKQLKENKLKEYSEDLAKKGGGFWNKELTAEIPFGSLPFGVIIRLKPVIEINVGLYGQGEVTVWTSSEYVETEVKNGRKIKDVQKKLDTTPPSNISASVYGNFNVKGGVELLLGLGKRLGPSIYDKAVGIGAFLEGTINIDFNLGGKTDNLGNLIGQFKDGLVITGKGKFGGKILTGGIFGDITLGAKEFTWWDGVSLGFNPKFKWASDDRSVDKGDYIEQQFAWYFSSGGMVWSNNWAMYNKPVLGVFEKGAIDTSKPVAVLRSADIDQGFNKNVLMKLNKKYTFTFNNTEKKDYEIIPGVTTSSKNVPDEITWYPEMKRTIQVAYKPSIEYYTMDNYDDKGVFTGYYDYVFQTLGRNDGDGWWTYSFSLPFTLRNAAYINDYWDDWGVHFEVHGDAAKSSYDGRTIPAWNKTSGWKSLKNKFTKSGSYKVTTSFSVNSPEQPVWCDAVIWYKPKGTSVTYSIRQEEAWPFSYQCYNYNKSLAGDIPLNIKNYVYLGKPWEYPIPGYTETTVQLSSY